jgi:uncharacterized membrane protein
MNPHPEPVETASDPVAKTGPTVSPVMVAPDWLVFAPASFVILWSTGFIGMRLGTPYAEPFTFMAVRMAIVVVILLAAAAIFRAPWPKSREEVFHAAVAGILVHATYLSGVLYAISLKLPLAFTALIAGMQPILTGIVASVILGERLRPIHWLGMLLGLVGVTVRNLSATRYHGWHGLPKTLLLWNGLANRWRDSVFRHRLGVAHQCVGV